MKESSTKQEENPVIAYMDSAYRPVTDDRPMYRKFRLIHFGGRTFHPQIKRASSLEELVLEGQAIYLEQSKADARVLIYVCRGDILQLLLGTAEDVDKSLRPFLKRFKIAQEFHPHIKYEYMPSRELYRKIEGYFAERSQANRQIDPESDASE